MGTLACGKPGVAPGLDQYTCDGGPCAAPGVIRGQVVYDGPARGDAILLLFDTRALPPPDGNGTGAVAVARVKEPALFQRTGDAGAGAFSAPFTFTQVPSGRSYRIRAFIDATREFVPVFDYAQQPRAGDPAGTSGDIAVAAFGTTREQPTLQTFYEGLGGGWFWRGFGDTGVATTTVENTPVGTLVVDMFDGGTKKLI